MGFESYDDNEWEDDDDARDTITEMSSYDDENSFPEITDYFDYPPAYLAQMNAAKRVVKPVFSADVVKSITKNFPFTRKDKPAPEEPEELYLTWPCVPRQVTRRNIP